MLSSVILLNNETTISLHHRDSKLKLVHIETSNIGFNFSKTHIK